MLLFLTRHGETVDNIAGIYAGVKDSPLTAHGHLQAERLGQYFADRGLCFTHVFSSDLQRAHKTAAAICLAQPTPSHAESSTKLGVLPLGVLREQDFGFYEGKPFSARSRNLNKSGKDAHRSKHLNDQHFKDVESKQSMVARMDQYLHDHLFPIWDQEDGVGEATVAIVSHGIILSHLWRCLLKVFPKHSVALSPGIYIGTGGVMNLEFLGGWSNTGYLELQISKDAARELPQLASAFKSQPISDGRISSAGLLNSKMVIKTVNGTEHLIGLKRTRGIGSTQYDEGQKKIMSYFEKRKV
ncbi:MAG: hypothetical protein Q9163_000316 [Psora crenata]